MEPRVCPQCHRSEPEVSFYRKSEICRHCIRGSVVIHRESLETQVERHRQEKLVRAELKKIAKARYEQRARERQRRKKQEAVAAIMPKAPKPDEAPVVDAATKELATRTLQRRRLLEFVKMYNPRYKAGWVHVDICARLEKFMEDVRLERSPRLMILMPPRHGKSEIASKRYPAFHLGHNPHHEIIACSYNVSLAMEFSREVRGAIRTPRYGLLFPGTRLDKGIEAAEAWKLESPMGVGGGGYVAAGVNGPINGKGANVLLIDDPIKNAEEAESNDHLLKLHNWYDSTAYTRLAPGGGVLLIQTWWSDNDLAGRIQEEMKDPDADQFEIVKYPAIATHDEEFRLAGEALHPARYDLPALEKIRKKLGGEKGKYWSALYQQNPTPEDGSYFTAGMITYRTEAPELSHCFIYQAWDFAAGEKRVNDWTVGVTIAVDWAGKAHVIELRRFKTADQLRQADEIIDMFVRYNRVMAVGVEKGQIWSGIKIHLATRCKERSAFPAIEELTPLTDKTLRARALQGRMQQGMVTFPTGAGWLPDATRELLRFPNGMHDDIVDAMSWCISMTMGHAAPPRPVERQRRGDRELTVAEKVRQMARGGDKNGHMAA